MDSSITRPLPSRLSVTVWDRPGGGCEVWLDALAIDADGDTEAEALEMLVAEVRWLAAQWAQDESLRLAPNWQLRGGLIELLSSLSDAEIRVLLDPRRGVEPERPLDG